MAEMEEQQDDTFAPGSFDLSAKGVATRNPGVLAKNPKVAGLVKMLGDYELELSNYAFGRDPVFMGKLGALAKEYNPQFNMGQYKVRQDLRKKYLGGNVADSNAAMNRAIGHLDTYLGAVEKDDNLGIGFGANKVRNWWRRGMGDTDLAALDAPIEALAGELTKTFAGGNGALADRKDWKEILDKDGIPAVQRTHGLSSVDLLASKIAADRATYMEGMGEPPVDIKFLKPESRDILKKYGYDPDKIEMGMKGEAAKLKKTAAPKSGVAKTLKDMDDDTARFYLQKAGGDIEKARGLARADGYK